MTKSKILQLENLLDDCQRFLELVPLEAIAKGMTWFPSEEALQLGRIAKNAINEYNEMHRPIRNS